MILDGTMMNRGDILESVVGRDSDVLESMMIAVKTINSMMMLQGRMLGRKVLDMVMRRS